MNWKIAQSTVLPEEFDVMSSKTYNYIRKNIREVESEDVDGNKMTMYEYEELAVPKEFWSMCLDLEQAKADIDYLNMLTEDL